MLVTTLAFVALLLSQGSCEKGSGSVSVKDDDGMGFIGKFCFQDTSSNTSKAGYVSIELSYSGAHKKNWYFVMYDDQSSSWPYIHDNDDLSCSNKIEEQYTHYRREIGFWESDTVYYNFAIKEHIRPRWWWAYVVNCDIFTNSTFKSNVKDVSYDYHFYQNVDSMWNKEFGVNDRGLNTMYLFFLCFYVVLLGTQLYAFHIYRTQEYVHQIIKLLTSVIGTQLFAVLFSFVDWMIFTETGKHELFFQIISEIGYVASNTIFLLLLLVLGQGWTISRFEVVWPKTILLICILSALTQCGIYIWTLVGFDEETTKYYYDTLPEWIYGGLFIVVGILYVVECVNSIITETFDQKKRLFIILCVTFSLWFTLPICSILIADTFTAWRRDVAIEAFQVSINTLSFMAMMGFMWPTWAGQYFNLSVGDTQDRILSGSNSNGFKILNQNRL